MTPPYSSYRHGTPVVAGDTCPTNAGSSITGLAFYDRAVGGANYPTQYDGALFFADHSRNCVWAMPKGANGLPDKTGSSPSSPAAARST